MMLEAGGGIMEFSKDFFILPSRIAGQVLALAGHAETGAMHGLGWLLHKNDM